MIPHSKPTFGKEEIQAIEKLFKYGQLGINKEVELFEQEFAKFIGVKYAIAVHSGSAALHLALRAVGASSSSQVVIPTYSCAALLNTVLYVGARPILCDSSPITCNLEKIPVAGIYVIPHMFGLPARIPKKGLVIEDCAVALGAKIKGKMCGCLGNISVFSFYDTKMISTGQGGMVATNDRKIADRIRDLVGYDKREDYLVRYNYRMSGLNAAVGRIQVTKVVDFVKKRRNIAEIYYKKLKGLPLHLPPKENHIFYRFSVRVESGADDFIKYMLGNGVDCKRPVYRPLHRYFAEYDRKSFPGAEELHEKLVSIPIYPSLKEKDAEKISDIISRYF